MNNADNLFYLMGKKSTDFGSVRNLWKFIFLGMMPRLAKWLDIRVFSEDQSNFYHDLVHGTIKHREKEGIVRPDMINLLMAARKGSLKSDLIDKDGEIDGFATVEEVKLEDLRGSAKQVWDDEDVTAQCFLFFVAGFETASTLLCFAANELMENPDVQRILIDEVDTVTAELRGKPITYDVLQKMKYLDMVVSGKIQTSMFLFHINNCN